MEQNQGDNDMAPELGGGDDAEPPRRPFATGGVLTPGDIQEAARRMAEATPSFADIARNFSAMGFATSEREVRNLVEDLTMPSPQAARELLRLGVQGQELCGGRAATGHRCRNRAGANGLCWVHTAGNEPPRFPMAGERYALSSPRGRTHSRVAQLVNRSRQMGSTQALIDGLGSYRAEKALVLVHSVTFADELRRRISSAGGNADVQAIASLTPERLAGRRPSPVVLDLTAAMEMVDEHRELQAAHAEVVGQLGEARRRLYELDDTRVRLEREVQVLQHQLRAMEEAAGYSSDDSPALGGDRARRP